MGDLVMNTKREAETGQSAGHGQGDSGIPEIIWAVTHMIEDRHNAPIRWWYTRVTTKKENSKNYVNKRVMSVQVLKQSVIA